MTFELETIRHCHYILQSKYDLRYTDCLVPASTTLIIGDFFYIF